MSQFGWLLSEFGWLILEIIILLVALGNYGLSRVEKVKNLRED
jgi:hypothetical protein